MSVLVRLLLEQVSPKWESEKIMNVLARLLGLGVSQVRILKEHECTCETPIGTEVSQMRSKRNMSVLVFWNRSFLSEGPKWTWVSLQGSFETVLSMWHLTLSPTAPFAPPCPTALGLIGPRKKEKKNWFWWRQLGQIGPRASVESHCYSSLPPPSPSGFPIHKFHLCCLWYITKDNIWIIGKQPRSFENISLETLFVTKP